MANVHGRKFHAEFVGVHAGAVAQILNDRLHAVGVAVNDVDQALLLIIQFTRHALAHEVSEADHACQRVLQLVGSKPHKLALAFVGLHQRGVKLGVGDGNAGVLCQALGKRPVAQRKARHLVLFQDEDGIDVVPAENGQRNLRQAALQPAGIIGVDADVHSNIGLFGTHHAADDACFQRPAETIGPFGVFFLGVAFDADDFKIGRVLISMYDAQRACLGVEHLHGAAHRNGGHLADFQGAIEVIIDAFQGLKLTHALGQLQICHAEQARIFNGNGSLPREGRHQLCVFLHKAAAVLLVQHFQHADHVVLGDQRHSQQRLRLIGVGDLLVGFAGSGIVVDGIFASLYHLPCNPFAGINACAQQRFSAADHHPEFKLVFIILCGQQQRPCLTVQDFDRACHDDLQQFFHIAFSGYQLAADVVQNGELALTTACFCEQACLVD